MIYLSVDLLLFWNAIVSMLEEAKQVYHRQASHNFLYEAFALVSVMRQEVENLNTLVKTIFQSVFGIMHSTRKTGDNLLKRLLPLIRLPLPSDILNPRLIKPSDLKRLMS